MNPFGGMIRMNRMIPAGLGGKNKRDEWMEPLGGMNRMTGGVDGWMNPFVRMNRMNRMNRMIPAGLGGRRKTSQLNTLEGDPSEMRYARHGHEFNGVNPVQPQYHLPELPQ